MNDDERGGFDYFVSDEQIATYSALPIHVRIAWVEETARRVRTRDTGDPSALGGAASRCAHAEGSRSLGVIASRARHDR